MTDRGGRSFWHFTAIVVGGFENDSSRHVNSSNQVGLCHVQSALKARLSVILVCLSVVAPAISAQAATPRPGRTCSKQGLTAKVNGTKLICSKSGSKLLWKASIPKALAPIPITLPVAPSAITFANALDHVSEIAGAAFDSVHSAIASNPMPSGIKATIWIGPNTVMIGNEPAPTRFTNIMKVWSGFYQPKIFGAFFFSTVDEPAAESAFNRWVRDSALKNPPPASNLADDCRKGTGIPGQYETGPIGDCRNANAGIIDVAGTGMALFGVPNEPGSRADAYRAGALENHEYTHMVQGAQFLGNGRHPGQMMQEVSPCWLQEGMAHFAGKSSASATLADFLQQRNGEALQRTNAKGQLPPRDVAAISKYLSLETLATCGDTYNWGYATGMLAVEALSAIGGVQSTMALYTMEARGYKFSDAFKLVYGISWAEAQPILVKIIAADYLQENMAQ